MRDRGFWVIRSYFQVHVSKNFDVFLCRVLNTTTVDAQVIVRLSVARIRVSLPHRETIASRTPIII